MYIYRNAKYAEKTYKLNKENNGIVERDYKDRGWMEKKFNC